MLPYRENIDEKLKENHLLISINQREDSGIMVEKHWHPCFEIQHIIQGSALQNINGINYTLEKGDTILIPPGIIHMTKALESGCKIHVVLFAFEEINPGICLDSHNNTLMSSLLSQLNEENLLKKGGYLYIQQGIFLQILGFVLRYGVRLNTSFATNKGQEIDEYLRTHLITGISLQDVAESVGYSVTYFSRYFKSIMGISFREYCERLKMQAAEQMLNDGYSVNETSLILNYCSASSFARAFKRWTGNVPSKFQI